MIFLACAVLSAPHSRSFPSTISYFYYAGPNRVPALDADVEEVRVRAPNSFRCFFAAIAPAYSLLDISFFFLLLFCHPFRALLLLLIWFLISVVHLRRQSEMAP